MAARADILGVTGANHPDHWMKEPAEDDPAWGYLRSLPARGGPRRWEGTGDRRILVNQPVPYFPHPKLAVLDSSIGREKPTGISYSDPNTRARYFVKRERWEWVSADTLNSPAPVRGGSTMTLTNVIEMVVVAVLIYAAVLKFRKGR
jgi:hypothetical protein